MDNECDKYCNSRSNDGEVKCCYYVKNKCILDDEEKGEKE